MQPSPYVAAVLLCSSAWISLPVHAQEAWEAQPAQQVGQSQPSQPSQQSQLSQPQVSQSQLSEPQLAQLQPAQQSQPSREARLAEFRERVARLEDQEAIENLQAMFGYFFDKGLWEDAADLFARDGRFEYGQSGVYIGQERIRRAMLLLGPEGLGQGYLNNHMQLQPVVVVAPDGTRATGRWQGMVQLAEPGTNGIWGVGIYENTYVKEDGVWKIENLHFYPTAFTDYDRGWARSLLPMKGPSALFPPDEPPTEVYRTMPGNYIPPFSYNHPVTGEPLKDLPQDVDSVLGR